MLMLFVTSNNLMEHLSHLILSHLLSVTLSGLLSKLIHYFSSKTDSKYKNSSSYKLRIEKIRSYIKIYIVVQLDSFLYYFIQKIKCLKNPKSVLFYPYTVIKTLTGHFRVFNTNFKQYLRQQMFFQLTSKIILHLAYASNSITRKFMC